MFKGLLKWTIGVAALFSLALLLGYPQYVWTQAGQWLNIETQNVIFEGTTVDAFELTLATQDPTADVTQTLMAAAGAVHAGYVTDIVFCGQLENAGTNYLSPSFGGFSTAKALDFGITADNWGLGGDGCDAEDSTTEATADEIVWVDNAVKVLSFMCEVTDGTGAAVVIDLRSAAADTTPANQITIATGDQTGVSNTISTTDIAAGATMAVKTVTTSDESTRDAWCVAKVLVLP